MTTSPRATLLCAVMLFLLPAMSLTTDLSVGLVEAVLLLGALACAGKLWQQRRLHPALFAQSRFITLAFALNLLVALASLLATGFEGRFLENPSKILLASLATGMILLLRPPPRYFWFGLVAGTIGAAGFAVYQRFGLMMPRAEGFSMPITFGNLALVMGLMSLASVPVLAKTRWAVLPYVSFVAGVIASVLSGSRGGWLALLLCCVPLYTYGRHAFTRRTAILIAVTLILLGTAAAVPQTGIRDRLSTVATDIDQYRQGNPESSVGARLEMWKGAAMLIAEHPLTGVGRANFNQELTALIARGEIHPAVHIYHHAHSEMLHALATQGLIGALVLIALYGVPLQFFRKQLRSPGLHRPYALAGVLLSLSYIDFGLTQVMFAHHVPSSFYALTVCTLAGLCLQEQRRAAA